MAALVKSCALAVWDRKVVGYSRADRTADNRRMLDVIAAAVHAGLLVNVIAPRGSPHCSRLIPTPKLLPYLPFDPWYFMAQPHQNVVLRDRSRRKNEIPIVVETSARRRLCAGRSKHAIADQTQLMLELVNWVNHYYRITATKSDLPGGGCGRVLNTRQFASFSGSFDKGGRIYTKERGHQSLRKHDRASIRFDGPYDAQGEHLGRFHSELACDVDFGCCHPIMLFHLCGVPIDPRTDIYWLWDQQYDCSNTDHVARRELMKKLVNTSLNARSRSRDTATRIRNAIKACERQASQFTRQGRLKHGKRAEKAAAVREWLETTGLSFEALMNQLTLRQPALVDHFCTDIGVTLQRIDSHIALLVLHEFARIGVPALSMHDALIVPESYGEQLRIEMALAYANRLAAVDCPGMTPRLDDGPAIPSQAIQPQRGISENLKILNECLDVSPYLKASCVESDRSMWGQKVG